MSGIIDRLILARVESDWIKGARLAADVLAEEALGNVTLEELAGRLRALIRMGWLEVQGDPGDWRFCEVRRARR